MRRPSAASIPPLVGGVLLVALYAALWMLPASRPGAEPETIVLNPWRGQLYLLTLGTAVAVVILAFLAARRQGRPVWIPLALGLASPVFLCVGVGNDLGAYRVTGRVRDADGTEIHLLASHFLQGSELALGRLRHDGGPFPVYDVLARSPWEAKFGPLTVVRPESAPESRTLWITADRMVVATPKGNLAFLAYDLAARRAYGPIFNGNEGRVTDIRELSPFLLLGKADVPSARDFETLLDREGSDRPRPRAVEADLKSENPEVRALARRLLADLRAHPGKPLP